MVGGFYTYDNQTTLKDLGSAENDKEIRSFFMVDSPQFGYKT
jgi:hypothetical protein